MIYVWAALVSLGAAIGWLATLVGLPGTWGMVLVAVLLAWLPSPESMLHFEWWHVGVLAGLAGLGELIEFVASAAGVGKLGGSRRAATYAIIGSIAGALAGAVIGLPIPIPVVGSLIGSVLFSGIGAAAGAFLGEHSSGKALEGSVKVGVAAFLGRIFGTIGKTLCATVMMVFLIVVCWS
jgi:hypothetical protein